MGWYDRQVDISILRGQVLKSVEKVRDEQILFETESGEKFSMHHSQSCCEEVYIEDIVGDLHDLVGSPILRAEVSNANEPPTSGYEPDSYTWTFYKLDTFKGGVTIRWFGSSNGYYGEEVSLYHVEANDK